MKYEDLKYLAVPLPEDILKRKWAGDLEGAVRAIDMRLEKELPENPAKKEFLLPMTVGELLKEGKANVKVLSSADKWYGVTYAADKLAVQEALREMIGRGMYPKDGLWNK